MKITKAILTTSKELSLTIALQFWLEEIESIPNYKIYAGTRIWEDEEEEQIVLAYTNEDKKTIDETLQYLFETYVIFKFISVWIVSASDNIDIASWDVVLPNTFIATDSENPVFLDYAIGENYDFTNFGLVLSGICITWKRLEKKYDDEYISDIQDNDAFYVLEKIKEHDALDKAVVIKWVFDSENTDTKIEIVLKNTISILDFIL